MLSKIELWALVESVINSLGSLKLYDVDLPRGNRGEFKVFITKKDKGQVTHDDCAKVSRALDECEELDYLRNDAPLIVSSPGVNRILRRNEHFEGALGERVRVSYTTEDGGTEVALGVLKNVEDNTLAIECEDKDCKDKEAEHLAHITLNDVRKARVDFLFGS